MLCSDDKHPDELLDGHINKLVRRAVERGIDVYDALRAACIMPIEHYKLDVGQLRVGDPADFIEVDSLKDFNVLRTWIDGQLVAEHGTTTIPRVEPPVVNKFVPTKITAADIDVSAPAEFDVQAASDRSARRAADHESARVSGARLSTRQVVSDARASISETGGCEPLLQSAAGDGVHQELRAEARGDGVERCPRFAQCDRGRRR